jgi:hypothetical protein
MVASWASGAIANNGMVLLTPPGWPGAIGASDASDAGARGPRLSVHYALDPQAER